MESVFHAIQRVRDRQSEIVHTLSAAGIPFALSGSNATFVWIASIDESATRQYRNVEFIIEREDIDRVVARLTDLGLIADVQDFHILYRNEAIRHDRWADMAIFAGEPVAGKSCSVPNLDRIELINGLPAIGLDRLVSFQLSRWLLDDQVDLRDLISVGLIDDAWIDRVPQHLSSRLSVLLEDPDG
jgi:hypothetical protein